MIEIRQSSNDSQLNVDHTIRDSPNPKIIVEKIRRWQEERLQKPKDVFDALSSLGRLSRGKTSVHRWDDGHLQKTKDALHNSKRSALINLSSVRWDNDHMQNTRIALDNAKRNAQKHFGLANLRKVSVRYRKKDRSPKTKEIQDYVEQNSERNVRSSNCEKLSSFNLENKTLLKPMAQKSNLDQSAATIQKFYQVVSAVATFKRYKAQREANILIIQSAARGYLSRLKLERLKVLPPITGTSWHDSESGNVLPDVKEDKRSRACNAGIVIIQSLVRRFLVRLNIQVIVLEDRLRKIEEDRIERLKEIDEETTRMKHLISMSAISNDADSLLEDKKKYKRKSKRLRKSIKNLQTAKLEIDDQLKKIKSDIVCSRELQVKLEKSNERHRQAKYTLQKTIKTMDENCRLQKKLLTIFKKSLEQICVGLKERCDDGDLCKDIEKKSRKAKRTNLNLLINYSTRQYCGVARSA